MRQEGLKIAGISVEEFSDFARRYADSPEIGSVKTGLEDELDAELGAERLLVGLRGCDKLCAAACLRLFRSKLDEAQHVVRLDSAIVDHALRRRGLAGLLTAQSFLDLVSDGARQVSRIYAHSVHPATVRMLRRLTCSDPQATGAPISSLGVDAESRDGFMQTCEVQIQQQVALMRLQCTYRRKRDRRARPWCLPPGEKPDF